jgi:hypothetical protein
MATTVIVLVALVVVLCLCCVIVVDVDVDIDIDVVDDVVVVSADIERWYDHLLFLLLLLLLYLLAVAAVRFDYSYRIPDTQSKREPGSWKRERLTRIHSLTKTKTNSNSIEEGKINGLVHLQWGELRLKW